jgi:hypothetical protein
LDGEKSDMFPMIAPIWIPAEENKPKYESVLRLQKDKFDELKDGVIHALEDLGHNKVSYDNEKFYEKSMFFHPAVAAICSITYFLVLLFVGNFTNYKQYPADGWGVLMWWLFFPLLFGIAVSFVYTVATSSKLIENVALYIGADDIYLSVVSDTKAEEMMIVDAINSYVGNIEVKKHAETSENPDK